MQTLISKIATIVITLILTINCFLSTSITSHGNLVTSLSNNINNLKIEKQYTHKCRQLRKYFVQILNNDKIVKSWTIEADTTSSNRANNYDWVTRENDDSKYIGNLGRTAIGGALVGGPIGSGVEAYWSGCG